MSYVYSFYNYLGNFPQPLYPLYNQTTLQDMFQPIVFTNNQQTALDSKIPQKFEPILLSTQTSLQSLASCDKKQAVRRGTTQIRKELVRNKDQNFGWRNQNKERNVISSILKGYAQFVLQGRGMVKLIEQLSKKRQLQNGVSKFYEYMTEKFPARKSYVGLRYVQQLLGQNPSDNEMAFLLRITLQSYLKEIYPMSVVQGSKLKKKNKLALLKKIRSINLTLFMK